MRTTCGMPSARSVAIAAPVAIYLGVAAIVMGSLAVAALRRAADPRSGLPWATAFATATVFFASPHYAWYFVWLTVLLCLAPWWPAFWLTLTAVLLYYAPQTGHVPIWVGFVIYGGFVMLACADIVWRLFGARIGEQFGSHRAD